jgi:hypothetical protein
MYPSTINLLIKYTNYTPTKKSEEVESTNESSLRKNMKNALIKCQDATVRPGVKKRVHLCLPRGPKGSLQKESNNGHDHEGRETTGDLSCAVSWD